MAMVAGLLVAASIIAAGQPAAPTVTLQILEGRPVNPYLFGYARRSLHAWHARTLLFVVVYVAHSTAVSN